MRPFTFKAGEVNAPAFTVNSATQGVSGVTVTWNDPTPSPYVLGATNNEIGFRVERADGSVAVTATTFGLYLCKTARASSVIIATTKDLNTVRMNASYFTLLRGTIDELAKKA